MHLGKGREGMSLFGIMNRCRSVMGKKLMRHWFLRPLQNPDEINGRLDAVQWFCLEGHAHMIERLQSHLRQIVNIRSLFFSMKTTIPSFKEFVYLQKVTYLCIINFSLNVVCSLCSIHKASICSRIYQYPYFILCFPKGNRYFLSSSN